MIISGLDRVENIVGKGENAGYQHFLHFPQCFEKAFFPDTSKGVIVWERVNCLPTVLSFNRNNVEKLEKAGVCYFLFLLQFF